MKKRLLLLFLTVSLILVSTFNGFVLASEINNQSVPITNPTISVDGKLVNTNNYQMYSNKKGSRMYPLRLIAESLGAKVLWDSSNNIQIIQQDRLITLNPNSDTLTINGVTKKYNRVEVSKSRIYVPAEFISEIMGARYQVDEKTNKLSIQKQPLSKETTNLTESQLKIKNNLAAYLSSLELNRNFSGQILVEQGGITYIDRAYGYSDYENKIKAFTNTSFAIGSVTKQFTATAIVMLAERNKLDYNDLVSKYLPNVPHGDKITLHQLLTHTSGLSNYTNLMADLMGRDVSKMSFDDLMELIKDEPLDFEPGTNFNYSNTGYLILGRIVEKVSGKTLENYFEENIFIPFGMENTGIAFRGSEKLVEAKGYIGHMEVVPDQADQVLLNIAYGAGYLSSTAQDLAIWNNALLDIEIIFEKGLERMFGKSPDMNLLVPYAYGWMFNKGPYGEVIFHGGNTIGFTSQNAIYTDMDAQIIILTNKGYADLASIESNIAAILSGKVVAPLEELTYISVSEEQMKKYAGTYEIKNMLKINVFVENGKFMFQGEGQPAIELSPLSETKFEASAFGISIEFDSKDTPTGFILNQAGIQLRADKIK